MATIPQGIIDGLKEFLASGRTWSVSGTHAQLELARHLARRCFALVKGLDENAPSVRKVQLENCIFERRFENVGNYNTVPKERVAEFKKSYAWLLRIRDTNGLVYPRIVYDETALKHKRKHYEEANVREVIEIYRQQIGNKEPETLANSGRQMQNEVSKEEGLARVECWRNFFSYCRLVVVLHEVAHTCQHWVAHFENVPAQFPDRSGEWVSMVSMKSKKKVELETDAWDGAKDLLEMLASAGVIQEFIDYPMLPQIIIEKILVPLTDEDIKATLRNLEATLGNSMQEFAKMLFKVLVSNNRSIE